MNTTKPGISMPVAALGQYTNAVETLLMALDTHQIGPRLWLKDHTIWQSDPTEIVNRLGWLDSPTAMRPFLESIYELADEVWSDGYDKALVLGMGGSSLAPEVFAKTYGSSTAHLELGVLDSTDADAVRAYAEKFPPEKTLYIVSSKSGGTVEMASFFKYLYNLTVARVGAQNAGAHFVAITDPGSGLADMAAKYHFRATFLNDPNIGGRYSALSYFGLVPAALDGVDLHKLLDRAVAMTDQCGPAALAAQNPGLWLGAVIGALASRGRDKLTLVLSPAIASFGDWVEQLIAESTGKVGKGVVPVVGELLRKPDLYGADRVFVSLQLAGDTTHEAALKALEAAGHPVVRIALDDVYDLGGQFFLWEYATAVAGHVMDIQPFDQPNVESAKILARKVVAAFRETGALPAQTAALQDGEITVYGDVQATGAFEALMAFLQQAKAGDYLALQAYLNPTDASVPLSLRTLREKLREKLHLATTLGYGPRFLHSTGQLHKGDGNKGLFVIFTTDPIQDAPIPDEAGAGAAALSFGVLKMAQALGDMQALVDGGRRVIRFHLGHNALTALFWLVQRL